MITALWLCLHPNTLTSLILLCICHLMLSPFFIFFEILICIVITIWHWYSWYWSLIQSRWAHIILHLHWLIKLTKAGLLGETVAGKMQGGVLGRVTPCGFGCHTWSCYLCVLLLLHVTWYLSPVNCFSLLSGSANASLVWYAVVLWDGAQNGCIS